MITLTNPIKISNSIGGTTSINYDRFELYNINCDLVNQIINSSVRIISSQSSTAPAIQGVLNIQLQGTPSAMLSIPNLGIFIPMAISGAVATVVGWMQTFQNNIEAGLVSLGTVTGIQATGL